MSTPAIARTIKLPKITVYLHRRHNHTIFTSYQVQSDTPPGRDTGLLTSQRIRSLDEAKQRISRRLAPFTKNVVYVDPPGEAAAAILGKE